MQRPKGFEACHSITTDHHPEWDISLDKTEEKTVRQILAGSFSYLASGAQAYAFESSDGRYVIKFFRMNHLLPRMIHFLRPRKLEKRKSNLHLTFNAYKLAYDTFRNEAGLVYIHLNTTSHLKTLLHVKDSKNKEHLIDLDQVCFVVQEKAELLRDRVNRLQGDPARLQALAEQFRELIRHRIALGLTDLDDGIENNYGFVGDKIIHLDVGKICLGNQPDEYERICAAFSKLYAL